MRTNSTISIYRLVKAWDGSVDTPDFLGDYNVWLEHEIQYSYDWINGQKVRTKIGAGFAILPEEVDLTDCFILIDDSRYDIDEPITFTDARRKFHHMEFVYK